MPRRNRVPESVSMETPKAKRAESARRERITAEDRPSVSANTPAARREKARVSEEARLSTGIRVPFTDIHVGTVPKERWGRMTWEERDTNVRAAQQGMEAGVMAAAGAPPVKTPGLFITRHNTSSRALIDIAKDGSLLMPSLASQRVSGSTLSDVSILTRKPESLPSRRLTFMSDARSATMDELRERMMYHPTESSALESLALRDYYSDLALDPTRAKRLGIGRVVSDGGEHEARQFLSEKPGLYTETKVYDRIPLSDTVVLVDRDATSAAAALNNHQVRQRMRALGIDVPIPDLVGQRKMQTDAMRAAESAGAKVIPYGEGLPVPDKWIAIRESGMVHQDAKGGDTRADAKGGDVGPAEDESIPEPGGASVSSPAGGGPRIVINPSTFRNEKDALCVAFNEAFRLVMEEMGFNPVAEPTEAQRRFFSDTAYADDELQLRRTVLARICTFDTSVKDPTDEQIQEAQEFLENVLEAGFPQNEWEQRAVQRIRDVIARVPTRKDRQTGTQTGPSQAPGTSPAGS